jgi:hypothetical protein
MGLFEPGSKNQVRELRLAQLEAVAKRVGYVRPLDARDRLVGEYLDPVVAQACG